MGIGGLAFWARVRPYAAFLFERTSVMLVFGSAGVLSASMRACRFDP